MLLIDVDGVARVIYVKDHIFSHVGTAFPLLLFYSDIIQLKEFETSPVLYFLIHRFDPSTSNSFKGHTALANAVVKNTPTEA